MADEPYTISDLIQDLKKLDEIDKREGRKYEKDVTLDDVLKDLREFKKLQERNKKKKEMKGTQ